MVSSKQAFRRLAWVAFANGVLLAVLAVGQAAGGSRSLLYGTFDAPNQVFGPFVNKNHYPFYIHLCAGLGLGLLLSAARKLRETGYRDELDGGGRRLDWLRSPRLIALLAGVAFGVGFVVVLNLVQWPFASFLMSLDQPNYFFGFGYWSYSERLGPWMKQFMDVPGSSFARSTGWTGGPDLGLIAKAMGVAMLFGMVSSRIGLAWGRWMTRVRR